MCRGTGEGGTILRRGKRALASKKQKGGELKGGVYEQMLSLEKKLFERAYLPGWGRLTAELHSDFWECGGEISLLDREASTLPACGADGGISIYNFAVKVLCPRCYPARYLTRTGGRILDWASIWEEKAVAPPPSDVFAGERGWMRCGRDAAAKKRGAPDRRPSLGQIALFSQLVLAAHVHLQRLGDGHGAVCLEVVLQIGDEHPRRGHHRVVEGVGEVVFPVGPLDADA